jgi:phospholipid N-methyltransferase
MGLKKPIAFLRETTRNFGTIGAVFPSSRFLAREIVSLIDLRDGGNVRVLEVGAGTGAVTETIVESLGHGDELDLYEINPVFVRHLKERFEHRRGKGKGASSPKVRVFGESVQSIRPTERYDFIISTLPFNSFEPKFVADVLKLYRQILKPGGYLTYFEYLLVREFTRPFGSKAFRHRIRGVEKVMKDFEKRYMVERGTVLLNVPPAIVRHLQFAKS